MRPTRPGTDDSVFGSMGTPSSATTASRRASATRRRRDSIDAAASIIDVDAGTRSARPMKGETIMRNANSGYSGYSMSVRAVAAYEAGEMPKSKWTKGAMLDAIEAVAHENGVEPDMSAFKKLLKAELFDRFFTCTAWHHTSKFFNETNFYGPNEDVIMAEVGDGIGEYVAPEPVFEPAPKLPEPWYKVEADARGLLTVRQIIEHYEAKPAGVVEHFTSKRGNDVWRVYPYGKEARSWQSKAEHYDFVRGLDERVRWRLF